MKEATISPDGAQRPSGRRRPENPRTAVEAAVVNQGVCFSARPALLAFLFTI